MISLKNAERQNNADIVASYTVSAPMPGERVSYEETLLVKVHTYTNQPNEKFSAGIAIIDVKGPTAEAAIARLAKWLRAMADELEKPREAPAIPLYNGQ